MVRSIEKSWFGLLNLDFKIFLHSTETQNRLRNYTDLYVKIFMSDFDARNPSLEIREGFQ